MKDLTWIGASGEELTSEQWNDGNMRCFGMLLDGRARETGIRRRGELTTLLIVFNSWQDLVNFKLPGANGDGARWTRVLDTNLVQAGEHAEFDVGHDYGVTGRSLVVFQLG